jgi:hypothetical protein
VRLRAGDSVDAVKAATWSEPVAAGAAPGLPAARYVQYRVELGSDGASSAELDSISLVLADPAAE